MTQLALLFLACSSSTGFTDTTPDVQHEEGAGIANFFPATEMVFDGALVGIGHSEWMKVTNQGDNALTVYEVSLSGTGDGQFEVEPLTQFTLQPKDTREWKVTVTLTDFAEAIGELRVKTSDADFIDARFAIHAYPGTADTADSGL